MGSLNVWGRKTVTHEERGLSTSDTRSSEILTWPALSLIKLKSFQDTQDGFISYQVFTNMLDMEYTLRNKKRHTVHHVCPQEGNKIGVQLSRPCLRSKGAGQPARGCELKGGTGLNWEGRSSSGSRFNGFHLFTSAPQNSPRHLPHP